jgi:hypothetical protein
LTFRIDFRIKQLGEKMAAFHWLSNGATYVPQPVFEFTEFRARVHLPGLTITVQAHTHQSWACLAAPSLPVDHRANVAIATITAG